MHAVNNAYYLGCARARLLYEQSRLEEATSLALCALEIYGSSGGAANVLNVKDDPPQQVDQAVPVSFRGTMVRTRLVDSHSQQ